MQTHQFYRGEDDDALSLKTIVHENFTKGSHYRIHTKVSARLKHTFDMVWCCKIVCPAPNCSASFVGCKLDEHLKTCRNLSSLQCETCEVLFKNPMSKCRHKRKAGASLLLHHPVFGRANIVIVQTRPSTSPILSTINTTVNNTNNYVIISPAPTNPFDTKI
jgi:hypothetical protein